MILIAKAAPGNYAPETWRRLKLASGEISATVVCARGHVGSLEDHGIAQDGSVSPSLVCSECEWHEYVRLEGWTIRRPWTYSMRQTARERPGPVTLGAGATGAVLWVVLPLLPLWAALLIVAAVSALWAHLFWDTAGAHVKHAEEFTGD